MSLDDARNYFYRCGAIFQSLQEAEQRMSDCEIRREQADAVGSKRLAEHWQSSLEFARAHHEVAEKQFLETTRTHDRHDALNVLVDMSVRFDELGDIHEQSRRALAVQQRLQLVRQLDGESEGLEEATIEAEQHSLMMQQLYQRATQLVLLSMPGAAFE